MSQMKDVDGGQVIIYLVRSMQIKVLPHCATRLDPGRSLRHLGHHQRRTAAPLEAIVRTAEPGRRLHLDLVYVGRSRLHLPPYFE